MAFLLRRIRNKLSKTPVREAILWYRNRHWTENDAFIGEYPKSGITWLRFLLFETLTKRSATWAEVNRVIIDRPYAEPVFRNGGRMVPTHESYRAEYKKAIYLVRDARDVVLSEYAFDKAIGIFSGDLDTFIDNFLKGKANGYGAWHKHVSSWLDAAEAGKCKMLLVKYEDMRRSPEEKLTEILEFLGVKTEPLLIHEAVQNNSLERMRAKEDATRLTASAAGKAPLRTMESKSEGNRFVRDGKIAGWRGRLTPEQLDLIESQAGPALQRLGYSLSTQSGDQPAQKTGALERPA